ncbi:serine/threonine-protein kinase [Ruminococcus sp.]|jgi:serine/threonine-protein kinase|uniref:serine/threonine protein kinase n=1 Tax=Ruminococcus sp. TaxID=41978 RepID=UPI00266EB44A|nr:serine/threonine-protein kinase [uncultured Ruminococcus sp.]
MLEIGSIIDGKYKILNVIGKGGMSVVYLAMNERANKQWAIKEVRKDGVQNFEVVKQNLIVETDLLKRLNHPHLPSIIDVIDGDGTFLIVMDYIEGNPLSKAIKNSGAQNQDDVIEWSKQLCDVLGYLHSRKPPIIYRDMKPSNVMLKPDGNVMLIDFGTAREFKSTSVADTTCLGTQGYAAPEQFGGHGQTDARTDIYCLGATMYHLITGHNPALPPYEMYPIRQWNPMLSSGLEEIILKCTQKNPDDRYQSCAELLYALDHYQDLDIENKKVQSLKWKTFIASVILTLVMLLGTVGFTIALSMQTSSTYEYYMNQAGNSMNEEESAQMYKNAIETDPSRIDGYSALLDLYSNNDFTADEYESFKNILNKDNYEEIVKSADPAAYADEIAYPLAENLYFNYGSNNSSGIDTSARWFKKAAENSNDEHIITRSQLLYKMVDSKKNLGTVGKNGDSVVSYIDYWNQLTQLATSDLPETENLKIALHIYNTVAMEIYNNNDSFISGGVTQSEYLAELDKLAGFVEQAHNSTLYTESADKDTYDALILNCNNAIDSARAALTKKAVGDNSSASVWG